MNPEVTRTVAEAREAVGKAKARGMTVGLAPTMGALHEGHLSLIRRARRETDYTAVTIFVNPTQFGPNEDLDKYPRNWESDLALCAAENADLIFAPEPSAVYPPDFRTIVEVGGLGEVLCGVSRPTHFRGVATVVLKLFNIIQPDYAYFGQKDAQQARLLEQMIADLNLPIQLRTCPIIREADGLALSSRNQYLNPDQRRHATVLFHALEHARRRVEQGERDTQKLEQELRGRIESTPLARLDYAAVVDYESLQSRPAIHGKALFALAVFFGDTRLIDNVLVDVAD